ncbi:hypothetical protein KSP40_PGU007618 [Platanthera guangdongensis]|uniref:Uncharacterized protein n=1 Tax=Platanthera guangdongensis TaxID=2320717 RepID=A0ABR2LDS7_9ASPA
MENVSGILPPSPVATYTSLFHFHCSNLFYFFQTVRPWHNTRIQEARIEVQPV